MVPEAHYQKLANGHSLHYIDQGAKDAQITVVFLHGSGSGASGHSNFKQNYPFLAAQGCRVIVPDLPGYGRSDKPQDVEYHLDFFVECVHQLLEALTLKNYILLGNSLGGAIALKYTLDFPKLVSGLILMAPGGIEEQADYFTMPGMRIMKATFAENKSRAGLGDFIRQGLVHSSKQHLVDNELLDERWEIALLQNAQVIQSMVVPNLSSRLHELVCPVLGFWGMNEKMMPESGIMTLAKNIKNIKMVLVGECGHWVMAEHRDLFNRYCHDFLQHLETY